MNIIKQSGQGSTTINLGLVKKVSSGSVYTAASTAHHIGVRIDKTKKGDARKTIKK